MIYEEKLKALKSNIEQMEYLKYTRNSLVYWDKITFMPQEGIGYRSKVMAFLGIEHHRRLSDKNFSELVNFFRGNNKNNILTDSMVKRIDDIRKYAEKIPEEEYSEYLELVSKTEQIWYEAKNKDDFSLLSPHLNKIIGHFKNFAEYWGYEKYPYDALMEYYLDDMDVDKAEKLIFQLKPFLTESLEKINDYKKNHGADWSDKINIGKLEVDSNTQKKIWERVLEDLGFSFKRGRIDLGSHTTVLANSPSDVRLVNYVDESNPVKSFYNMLHSGGKAIYQQSISEDLIGTFLAEAPSFALEEAIGRLYENIIGKSKGFFKYLFPIIEEKGVLQKDISVMDLYRLANCVEADCIRVDADELTYLLHIIIRYEIEKNIINDDVNLESSRVIWKDKYKEYLGIEPKTDREGILQDIHWSAGYFGYFPSYIVANLIAAQLAEKFEMECGKIDDIAERGEFILIKKWLEEKIFKYGAVYSTYDIVEKVTGKPLSSESYIRYLREKFSAVYKIKL